MGGAVWCVRKEQLRLRLLVSEVEVEGEGDVDGRLEMSLLSRVLWTFEQAHLVLRAPLLDTTSSASSHHHHHHS